MKKLDFGPIPGTRGYITENGVELIMTHGDLEAVRKLCTVTNKSALFQLKQAQKTIGSLERKIAQIEEDRGPGSTQAQKLQDIVEDKHREVKELKTQLKKEYWADREDGSLSLPAGFWWICEKIKDNAHLNSEIPYVETPVIGGKKPRPYQVEVCQELLKYKRASCVMPTGTGKSLMITMMAWSLVAAGKRVCIIEPTVELVDQTLDFMKQYFKSICAVGGGKRFKPGSQVCVTTIHSALENIDKFDAVLVDEFHHSAASTYNDTLFMALSAKWFYGFTACATRADGMSLGIHAACGPVVYEKTTRWAIENGYLVPAKIVIVEVGGLGQWSRDARHVQVYKNAMKSPRVMKAIMDLTKSGLDKGKKTMMLFKTVQAGEEVSDYAKTIGIDFAVASAQFRDPLRKFRKGETQLLVSNSALCGEGVDIPSVDAVINCCQVSSENMVRQILGRGLRLAEGKKELVCIDIVTKGFEPFERAAQGRLEIYREITDNIKFLRL